MRDALKFYLHKIGEHLQELAILAVIFVPLDRALTVRQILALCGVCGAILLVGIELERRQK